MDINFMRSLMTALAFLSFVGILVWAWLPGRGRAFDEAARIPFVSDGEPRHE